MSVLIPFIYDYYHSFMFLRRTLQLARHYAALLSGRLVQTAWPSRLCLHFLRASPLLLFTSTVSVCASETEPELQEITKQELVEQLNRSPAQEFVVIIYDRFKRLQEKEFGEELAPIVKECRRAGVAKVYLIDSKESQHLQQIVSLLKNTPVEAPPEDAEEERKKKPFEVYFKGRNYSEAFELEQAKQLPLSRQIQEIRHFEFTANPEGLNAILASQINNPWNVNRTLVVRQCIGEGECVESFRREVRTLIEQGMLNGKKDEYQFHLVVDQPSGILGSSSEYVRNFMREAERLRGKSMSANRKEETYVFRRDLLGSEVGLFSEWLDRQGQAYAPAQRFLMFVRPRVHLISRLNTMTDLMWFLRAARLNQQPSLSLNNTPAFKGQNSLQSLHVLQMVHSHFPALNYLIVNNESVRELIRHINADHKYVIFQQDGSVIWKKQFLDLDSLEHLPHKQQEKAFEKDFKSVIQGFIDNPQVKSLVQVEKELEIGLEKLMVLRNRQETRSSLRKYIVRVCRERCQRYLPPALLEAVNEKLQQRANVYWIDSTAQNIGVAEGDYLLKDGSLVPLEQALQGL